MFSEHLEPLLRETQQTQLLSGIGSVREASRSSLIVAATGLGKTVLMASIANHWPLGRVLMISHSFELNTQAIGTFENVCDEQVELEQGQYIADQCAFGSRSRLVVASVQSLNSKRKGKYRFEKFDPNEFGLIMIDEAHRAVSPTYRRAINYFMDGNLDCRLVGVTATPDRLDGVGMGHVFDSVACDLNIRWGIDNGWLVPVKQMFVNVNGLDLSTLKSSKDEFGESDFNQSELSELVEKETVLHEMVYPILDITADKQTIVFAVSCNQAKRMAEIINRHKPNSAIYIDGTMTPSDPRRKQLIRDYKAGIYQYFVNVNVATEGFDCRSAEYIAICRPTKSRGRFTQFVGRGTRFLEQTGIDGSEMTIEERKAAIASSAKPHCTVLDFVGMSGKHSLVCAADILAGDNEPKEIVDLANEIIRRKDFDGTVTEAMEKARKEREEELAAKRAKIRIKATYTTSEVDIWSPMAWVPSRDVRGFEGESPPSPKMKAALQKFGFTGEEVNKLNFSQAKSMMNKCVDRMGRGLASIKQRRLLSKYGIDASKMTFKQASSEIDAIARNGWRRPSSAPQE